MQVKWSRDKLLRELSRILRQSSDNKDKKDVLKIINTVISKDVSSELLPITFDVRMIPVCSTCNAQYVKACQCKPPIPKDDTSINALDALDSMKHDVHATTQDSVASDH